MMILVHIIGIVICLSFIPINTVNSIIITKKELTYGENLNRASDKNPLTSKYLEPAATTLIQNKATGSDLETHSGSTSGTSTGVRRYRGTGFGNIASSGYGFNYPTRYNIGSINRGSLGEETELNDFDDVDIYKNLGEDDDGIGYTGGVGNLVLGGLPQGNLGYGTSKSGLGLTSSLLNGGSTSSFGGFSKNLGGGIPAINPKGVEIISGGTHSDKGYEKGAESSSKIDHEAVAGEKATKGYKVAEKFDKAEKGEEEKAHHAGHYDATAGSKKGELDEHKKYSEIEKAAKGEKGENFAKSEGHKKGHKTTGFHNVYHKDEYKKDTSFYDDEHVSGHEAAFGNEGSRHAEVEGAHEKVEKLDEQFHEDEQAKKGAFTNGHQYGVAQGHDSEHANKEHFEKAAEFAKEVQHKAEKEESSSGSSNEGF